MTTSTMTTTSDARMSTMRKTALAAGLLYLATFVFSIPALALYDDVVNNPDFVLGAGNGDGVLWGGLIEVITGLTGIGTALVLYRVVKRYDSNRAVGFVAFRVLEASMIFVGVISLLGVFTLRQDFAGDPTAVTAAASALVAVKQWTFLLGPGLMPAFNAVCLATVLYRSRLVPRIIPTIGLVGAPLLLASFAATLFGAFDQVSGPALLFALPIAIWEFSLGVWLTVKGFNASKVRNEPEVSTAPPVMAMA
jgi:Domain of unknown function (DUF4386)